MPARAAAPPIPTHALTASGAARLHLGRTDGTVPYSPDVLLPHRKDYFLLLLLRRGGTRLWVDGTRYAPQPGTVFVTAPGQVQVKEEPQAVWGSSVAFAPAYLAAQPNAALAGLPLLRNPHRQHALPLTAAQVAFVETVLAQLEAADQQPGPGQPALLAAHLAVLLTYLNQVYEAHCPVGAAAAGATLLHRFQALLADHFRTHHAVADYAALLHVATGHFSGRIKDLSGRSALAHIHDRRGLEARRLLLHTDLSSEQIADHLGFATASYFGRFFRQQAGCTPGRYRRQHREMDQ